jgi:oxygen-independent coproporphyrinogen-3 oxidase
MPGAWLTSIDPRLREKYDVRGPRYTSYPAAPHFRAIDTALLRERWQARQGLDPDPGLSLYLHIPFCARRCLFCGCHTLGVRSAETVRLYLNALIREMSLAAAAAGAGRPVRQVAVGGGTPNTLTVSEVDRLISGLRGAWSLDDGAEMSVEIDPRTATRGKLDAFLRQGFNRFSLGVEDFARPVLKAVNRDQHQVQVEDAVAHLRARGCEAINFDLIYGLPRQTMESAAETAERTVSLRPSRIALYGYAHVPWIHPHQKMLEDRDLPDAGLKSRIFLLMAERFREAGYLAVGMDHFALPGDELVTALEHRTLRRTFMGYTTGRGLDVVGLGLSAISGVGSSYSQNTKSLAPYLEHVALGQLPVERGYLLDRDDEIRRELLLELFCTFHADLGALSRRFGIDAADYFAADFDRLEPMAGDGLVSWDRETIRVSDTGRFFIRNICMAFDRHLKAGDGGRTYSRTV